MSLSSPHFIIQKVGGITLKCLCKSKNIFSYFFLLKFLYIQKACYILLILLYNHSTSYKVENLLFLFIINENSYVMKQMIKINPTLYGFNFLCCMFYKSGSQNTPCIIPVYSIAHAPNYV